MSSPTDASRESAFLFSYFVGNGEDGLHLAWSADGLNFEAIAHGRSILAPNPAATQLMRDPFVLAGPNGDFHLVWTGGWTGQTIGYAYSPNLIDWSPQRTLAVMPHEPTVRNCWAPEIAYDAMRKRYLLLWSSTIPGRFPETEPAGDDGYNHRIYATTTTDFVALAPTSLLFDPGYNVIDATILPANDRFYLVFKDETRHPVKKNLRVACAEDIEGPYTSVSEPFTESWVEGPSAVRVGDEYRVYFDFYTAGRYGAARSRDLAIWEDISDRVSFPPGARHGAVFCAPRSVVDALIHRFG